MWQRSRITKLKNRLNQLTRRVKWESNNHRYDSYKTYLSNINPNYVSLQTSIKIILKQRNIIPPLKIEIAKYETNLEKCNAFAKHFENCFTIEDEMTNKSQELIPTHDNQNYIKTNTKLNKYCPYSPKEIQQIINRLANKRSPDMTS